MGDLQEQTKGGFRVVFAPVFSWFTQFLGLFVYGFGFFAVCLSFDYLWWPLALAATLGGFVLIAVGLYMARDRNHSPLGERIQHWRQH